MNKLEKYLKGAVLVMSVFLSTVAFAVTQKEMEQARTIAAKAYLRYANDGSGYLDDLDPKTMEELEASLKAKEKENIKAFKAIEVPSDYSGWDKDKLVEYWAVTVFKDKGLLEKGRGGRIRARSQINKMTITAPDSETAKEPVVESPAPIADSGEVPIVAIAEPAEETAAPPLAENTEELAPEDKAYNYTWVYIMILVILVAVVIALVVYAANVFKKNGNSTRPLMPQGIDNESELEKYKSTLRDKETEILMLSKKLESANKQNAELKSKIEDLTSELARLREASYAPASKYAPASQPAEEERKPSLRSIFLGRANSKGVFVRADRTLNIGNSVFILQSNDGFTGSFRVADSPAAWSLALSNPKEYLETSCTGPDLENTTGVTKILTETSGTAVFEGGCWRVIRKARIRYEK